MKFAKKRAFVTRGGGVSRIRRESYGKPSDWFALAKQVRERDGGICRNTRMGVPCGKPGKHVHHIIPLSRGGVTRLSNLILLCEECHKLRHSHM